VTLDAWCKENMDDWEHGYETTWMNLFDNLNMSVRMFKHDYGFWMIIGACPFGYGGDEKSWRRVNVGTFTQIDSTKAIIKGLQLGGEMKEGGTEASMDKQGAREILKDSIRDDGSLYNLGRYIAWTPGHIDACLNCSFTAEELEAVAWWMRNTPYKEGGAA